MTIEQPARGVADPCITQLDAGGAIYRLVAWSNGTQIRARGYSVHDQGQETLLFDKAVATAAANHTFDSVRCVNSADQYLVILWLDRDTSGGTYELDGAWLDVLNTDAVSTFTGMAAITIDDAGLYDAKQIEGASPSMYMIAYATSTSAVQVRRVTGSIITASAWSTSVTTNHADRVLAVHGDSIALANDGGVVIVYQGTVAAANELVADILDYSDGTALGSLTVVADTDPDHTAEYAAVGIARTTVPGSTNARVAVIAEYQNDALPALPLNEEFYAHFVVCREVVITSFAGVQGNVQRTANLNMLSKPYSYVDAESNLHVYCGLGYKTVRDYADWQEYPAFICDMGYQHWDATANTIRPRPVANYVNAEIDTAPHGSCPEAGSRLNSAIDVGRRMNHLSNWIPGPNKLCDTRKSRTVVWPGWSRLTADMGVLVEGSDPVTFVDRIEPTGATVEEVVHYLEDPWTVNRDPYDYTQPTENFHGSNPLSLYNSTEVQGELLVSGGAPCLYDGIAIVEAGFPWVPEIVDVSVTMGLAGLPEGEFRYVAVYEWTDTQGQLHRSGHGAPFVIDVEAGEGVTLTIRTLTIGSKEAAWLYPNHASIMIAVYRTNPTEADTFRRLHSTNVVGYTPGDTPVNDPSVWAIEVIDELSPLAHLLAATSSYIDGGGGAAELVPVCPPASHLVANWKNRAWLCWEKELWYSKENVSTPATGRIAPEYSPFLRYSLDVVKGEVTALQPMDDALVVFSRDGIYSLTGDGADALGANASLALQVLHEQTGCIEPRSIALCPMGILFQSYKGMYLLDKGGGLDHESSGASIVTEVGTSDVIGLSGNVRGATHLPDRHVIAFAGNDDVTDEPIVLKWEYYLRQWSKDVLEPPNSVAWLSSSASSCVWRGNERDASHIVLCQGGLLRERGRDEATPYADTNAAGTEEVVRVDLETGWIHLAGIAGHVRTHEIGVQLADQATDGAIDIQLRIDRYGTYPTGSPEVHHFGGDDQATLPSYLPVKPTVQRMTAFKLRLFELDEPENEAPLTIVGFSVRVGLQRGTRKINSATRGVVP
jgi:hypothetical protein